jgi:Cof subfamily protein (haloacid dehalogenase superfamily)
VRLIATDLDGTLLRPDGTVSQRTRATLAEAVASGVELVVVTARPPRFLERVADALDLEGFAICCNGALVYDLRAQAVVTTRALDLGLARSVVAALAAAGLGFAIETGTRVVCEPGYTRPARGDAWLTVADLEEMWRHGTPLVKLLAWSRTATADALAATAAALVAGVEVTHSGGSGLVEISAAGVTKVAAVAQLCADRGIHPADVVAFGDMPNDLALLRWAGLGYAMANAHPDVLAAAPARTGSNEQDGVAVAVAALLAAPLGC